jgi:gluconate 2-dehydrogenase gamma chain
MQMMSERYSIWRRHLLQSMALAVPAMAMRPVRKPAMAAPAGDGWQVLSPTEVALLEPLVARLIPADNLGPGALEAGVAHYIDGQMATPWAEGDHFYAKGPFEPGLPTQGYQFSHTPAALFRMGLVRLGEVVQQQHNAPFQNLSPEVQDGVLTQLEKGELDLSPIPGPLFFQTVLDLTLEGFFADPLYGGNRDMVGWKLVGFPGYYSSYVAEIERHNLPFTRPPQSLADLARAHAEDAQHGHAPSPQNIGHGGQHP